MDLPPVVVIDIDGLRPDMLSAGLEAGRFPNLARVFGGTTLERGLLIPALACAPSITFASQACLVTGAHPRQHRVPGSQFFDRFGRLSQGTPRNFAFDIGGELAFDDAIRTFTDGLAGDCLQSPTMFEQLGEMGLSSAVIHHMYARGAGEWRRPSLLNMGRLTKGPGPLRMSAEEYDRSSLDEALDYLDEAGLPDLLWTYFLGNDSVSHAQGPFIQPSYLEDTLDPLIGELWQAVEDRQSKNRPSPLWVVCSDHGHMNVLADDQHSIHLGFPFERELTPLFDSLGLDVLDFPGEDPHIEAVFSDNGGSAYVYVKSHSGGWNARPSLSQDVLPVGRAFWQAHRSGRLAPDLEGALSAVFVRDVEREGWCARYQALTPEGELLSLEDWFHRQPPGDYADPVHRLDNLAGPVTGDLLLLSNLPGGYYFGSPSISLHGGLHPQDSQAVLFFGWPGVKADVWDAAQEAIQTAIWRRCRVEGGRQPSTADLWTGLQVLFAQAGRERPQL